MQQGSKYRSMENQAWDSVYGRVRRDERAAALFVQLAEQDAALRTDRSALFVQANLTVSDAQRRRRRAEQFGSALGIAARWIVMGPILAVSNATRFAVAAFGAARSPESVAEPVPGPLPEWFLEDRQLMKIVLHRAFEDPVLREEMLGLSQAVIVARIEAQREAQQKAA
jgi:hypothetical protein